MVKTLKAVVTTGSLHFEQGDFSKGDIITVSQEELERLEGVQVINGEQEKAIKELKAEAETAKATLTPAQKKVQAENEKAIASVPKNIKRKPVTVPSKPKAEKTDETPVIEAEPKPLIITKKAEKAKK